MTFVPGLVLQPGESASFQTDAIYERFWAGDGSYQRTGGFFLGSPAFVVAGLAATAVGNRVRRNRALADSVPSWREQQRVEVIGTNQRLIVRRSDRALFSFWWSGMQEFWPEPRSWALVLGYADVPPLRLSGLAAPYVCVHVARHVLRDGWQTHPKLAELAR